MQRPLSPELHEKVTSIPQVVTTSPLVNSLDILPEPAAILLSLSPWTQPLYILDNSRDECRTKKKACLRLLVKENALEIYWIKQELINTELQGKMHTECSKPKRQS